MTKPRQIERSKTATREVTVRLNGYPAYERSLSGHHSAYWAVTLEFKCPGITRSVTVFQTDDYTKALERYTAYLPIVTD